MSTLDGIRIVSIALNVPGPVAASRLRQAGATVIKIEPPAGDPLLGHSAAWYAELHDGIDVQRCDLKNASDRERVIDLLADASLFMSSQRPSALKRLHLDAASLAAEPRTRHLRVLEIVGDTTHPEEAGHDLTYMAKAGLLQGDMPRTLVADLVGAERAYAAALLLLHDSPGTHAQIGLADSLDALSAPLRHGLTAPAGILGGGLAAYRIYDARDGRIAVAALEPHFRERLYRALQLPIDSALDEAFRSRTAIEWEAWAQSHDIPIAALRLIPDPLIPDS